MRDVLCSIIVALLLDFSAGLAHPTELDLSGRERPGGPRKETEASRRMAFWLGPPAYIDKYEGMVDMLS